MFSEIRNWSGEEATTEWGIGQALQSEEDPVAEPEPLIPPWHG